MYKLDAWDKKFFRTIGLTNLKKVEGPIIELDDFKPRHKRQKVFIKFMSDGGNDDNRQGDVFHAFLKSKKVKHDFSDGRKFIVNVLKLEKVLGFHLPEEVWGD